MSSILDKKAAISRKYLGQGGVHGIGVSKQLGAIKLHVAPPANAKQRQALEATIEKVRKEAAPFDVLTDIDEQASISSE